MSESLERYYTELSGALGQVMPDLLHLHYGVAESMPRGVRASLRVLREGPVDMLGGVLDAAGLDELRDGARAVDLGCGLGGTLIELTRRRRLVATGVDRNPVQLARARERARRFAPTAELSFLRASVTATPFAGASVDLATMVEVAFHVADKPALFGELARVLRPGGRAVLIDQEMGGGGLDTLGFFHFAEHGGLAAHAGRAGLRLVREVDLSEPVARWMDVYARFGSRPYQRGLLATALLRGGPRLAARLSAGLALYDRLIREELGRRPDLAQLADASSGIEALRRYTAHVLRSGESRYLALILERA